MKAAIIGATGYGGAELIRLLENHPEVEAVSVHSSSQEGVYMNESYAHLQQIKELPLEGINPEAIKEKADVVFLSTPSGVSVKITKSLLDVGLKVIDLSGDLRLKKKTELEKWYEIYGADEALLEKAVYGLTEWAREDVKGASVIANPGCYPTATLLGLLPLVKNQLVDADTIIVDAKSGVSGAGRGASAATHYSDLNESFKIYKVNEHKHIPEIEQGLRRFQPNMAPMTFSTHLVPMTRGIMATIYAKANGAISEAQLRDLYKETYANSPFVRIRPEGVYPATKEVYGSNYCDIGVTYDERTGRITVVSVIDNLVKGAAGQAIQNLNVMMGYDEKAGLNFVPVYP